MFPAPTTRSSDHSSSTNYGSCNDDIGDLTSEISRRDWEQQQHYQNTQQPQRSSLSPYQHQYSGSTSSYHQTESCGSPQYSDCKNEGNSSLPVYLYSSVPFLCDWLGCLYLSVFLSGSFFGRGFIFY